MKIKILLMSVVLTGLLLSLSASALTYEPPCGQLPIRQLNYVTSTQVEKFNPSLGELKSITLEVDTCGYLWRVVDSEDPFEEGVHATASVSAEIISNVPGLGERSFSIGTSEDCFLEPDSEPNDAPPDWTGNDSCRIELGTAANPECNFTTITITDPTEMAPYIGAGQMVTIPVRTNSTSRVTGSQELASDGKSFMGVEVCVIYEYVPPLCINGTKINDCTNAGIPDWEICLSNSRGVVACTMTNANGDYSFCDLLPGDYTVSEEDRDGWVHLDEPSRDVTLIDASEDDVDFLNTPLFCISGHKFNSKTGEGLANWTINLKDSTGAVIKTTTTGTGGYYEFCELTPGDYGVCEVLKPNWKAVGPICIDVALGCANSVDNDFENEPVGNLVCVCPFFIKNDLYGANILKVKVVDASAGILANDPAGSIVLNPESITIDPKYGTLTVEEDGSFVYDPTVATGRLYSGQYVIFKYTANNGLCDSQYPGIAKIQLRK